MPNSILMDLKSATIMYNWNSFIYVGDSHLVWLDKLENCYIQQMARGHPHVLRISRKSFRSGNGKWQLTAHWLNSQGSLTALT